MSFHIEAEKVVPYCVQDIVDLILDIESYTSFFKWCKIDITNKTVDSIDTIVTINALVKQYIFGCKVTSKKTDDGFEITMHGESSAFSFIGKWHVNQLEDNTKNHVRFILDMKVRSTLMKLALQGVKNKFTEDILQKFINEIERRKRSISVHNKDKKV